MKKIAVLLTVHNRKTKTLASLSALYNQSLPENCNIEVFLTDDGCTDGTPEAIRSEFPQVNIVTGDGNLFWNRGMYKAWEAASNSYDYDYYLWLNDDTILRDNAIKILIEDAYIKPNAVIVGTTCAVGNDKKITYGGKQLGGLITPNGSLQKCDTFNGNIVLVPRSIFKRIGNLDWTYQHAIGDLDYGWMVTHAGLDNFVSREIIGECDSNPINPAWMRPDVPFVKRWKNFHTPLAYGQPGPMFHYNKKNYGLIRAILVWSSNHVRVVFPKLWSNKLKK